MRSVTALPRNEAHKVLLTLEVTEQRRLSNSALSGIVMLAGCGESALGVARPRMSVTTLK